jgi:NtrC-family two-component system sensor histidine kinase KinB
MPLRRKLLAYLVVPALLLAMVGISGLVSLHHLEQAAGKILANNYRSIQEARTMERAILMLEISAYVECTAAPDCRRAATMDVRRFEESLAFCEGNITEEAERPLLTRIRASWQEISTDLEREAGPPTHKDPAVLELFGALREDLQSLVRVNEHAMFEMEGRTRRTARLMKAGVGVSLGAALLALIVFAFMAAGRISRPILEVADRLHQAVKRGPEPPRAAARPDEIDRLRTEMEEMLERLAAFQDEQRRMLEDARSRLALIMDRVLEGMVLVDEHLRVLAVNTVAARLLRAGDGEEILGRRLPELSPPDDVAAVLDVLGRGAFQPERDLGEICSSTGGTARVYRPRVLTVSRGNDRVEGYLLVFWDVTEEKRFEESRHRFISMLSHQLKTPMTSLSMSVSLLQEKLTDLPPRRAELLDMAAKDCRSLASLITELVDAARGTSPDFSLCLRSLDLNRLLRSALKPLAAQAEGRGIALSQRVEEARCEVVVDPVKFPWVVTNLVGNALRYTDAGGRIEVTTARRDDGVVVRVSDTGRGMPKELVNRIFTPFLSADPEPQPGTHGLGLTIVREIVEAHGGTIQVESEIGAGTTFTVWVPRPKGVES